MSRPTPPTYRTRNWPAYNEALKRRGSLTIWFDPEMSWEAVPTGRRGRQQTYSDAVVQTCLTMKVLFGMALRQTTGFVESLLRLVGLDWTVPDFSTLSRRQKTLAVNIPYRGSKGPLHLLIDSTGIKVEGEGEWHARKHGGPKRRVWRKIHLGIDEETHEVRAVEITGSHVGDTPVLPDLLSQIPMDEAIGSVTADGAYDRSVRGKGNLGHLPICATEPVLAVKREQVLTLGATMLKKTINSNLIQNIAALGSVQLISYLMPLVTLPYVTRTLGIENWGAVALAQTIIGYFTLLTNWGFSISGTKKISANRNNSSYLSETFIAIWAAQWVLGILAILLLLILNITFPFFIQSSPYYLWGMTIIIGNILFPIWFLSGLEQMKKIAAIQVISRLSSVPLVFIFIQHPDDAPLVIAINGLTSMISGIICILSMTKSNEIIWKRPKIRMIHSELKDGAAIFASTIWISLYTTFIPLALGLIAGNAEVGYYALADRVRRLVQSSLAPISQALFPRMSLLFQTNIIEGRNLLLKSSRYIIVLSAICSFALWAFAENIILILAGEEFIPAIIVLELLAPLLLVISISNIFGMQIMLPQNKIREFNKILGLAGLFSLAIMVPLIAWKGAIGAAINVIIVESCVTLSMAIYVLKTRLLK